MKRILCVFLLIATLLSAFSITVLADDNAQSGSGDTHGAATGSAWYNTNQYLWKVTLFVGKSDQASKSSNLQNDFHRLGTVVMKKNDWEVPSSVKFGSGTKVDYYSGAAMRMDATPKIVSDINCPRIPIVCAGNINTVKSYFGSTGTVSTVLNAIAEDKGTTKESMLAALNFTIGGQSKTGWAYSYIEPNGTTNRVPWVIVYEPMIVLNLKDKVTKLAFTATEFALCELNGWYDWNYGNGAGENCPSLPEKHLPTSVQLEESWFGYPVYAVTDDTMKWDYNDVVKGGGWGMRWLSVAIQESTNNEIDYGTYFSTVTTPTEDSYGTVTVVWRNYKSTEGTVYCELYRGSTKVWSGYKTIAGNSSVVTRYSVYYPDASTHTLTAKINYDNRNKETDPNDNLSTTTVKPNVSGVKYEQDYGVFFTEVEQPNQDSYAKATIWWVNWTDISGTALCEVYMRDELIYSEAVYFDAYEEFEQTFSIYYPGYYTRELSAWINWGYKDYETDPNDNSTFCAVTPVQTKDDTYEFSVSDISVSPNTIYQGEFAYIYFISDNWNRDIAYEDILVELLVGDSVVKSEYVDFYAYGRNEHLYYVPISSLGSTTVTARINWPYRYGEDNTYNNSVSTTVAVNRNYEFSVSDLQVKPETCFEYDTVTVTFRTDSWDVYNAYEDIAVEFLYNGDVLCTEYVDYEAYGGKNHTINLYVGSITGINDIKVRVNWQDHLNEVDSTNNETGVAALSVRPKIDLSCMVITPNSDYREGVTVITSVRVFNNSRYNIIPNHHNTVSFEAYYYNNDEKVVISSQKWKQVVIPSYSNNLVYFKWTVPENSADKTVYCTAVINAENGFLEYDTGNNTKTLSRTIAKTITSQTPDTQFESSKPEGFSIPSTPSTDTGCAEWSLWSYSNGEFIKTDYGITFDYAAPYITPDEDNPSAEYKNGLWQMKSGYGFYVRYWPMLTQATDCVMPSDSAFTGVQRVEVTFPEFGYSKSEGKFRTLEVDDGIWVFTQNTNADFNERLHFTPIWHPNGDYIVAVTATEVWTPAGMISSVKTSNTIEIVDSAYDDWYVSGG